MVPSASSATKTEWLGRNQVGQHPLVVEVACNGIGLARRQHGPDDGEDGRAIRPQRRGGRLSRSSFSIGGVRTWPGGGHFRGMGMIGNAGPAAQFEAPGRDAEEDQGQHHRDAAGDEGSAGK